MMDFTVFLIFSFLALIVSFCMGTAFASDEFRGELKDVLLITGGCTAAADGLFFMAHLFKGFF